MFTTTEQAAPASPKRHCNQKGFTIPELLVSLCITVLLLNSFWQWNLLMERSSQRIRQNQQAIVLAQEAMAGIHTELPEGWDVQIQEEECGALLTARRVQVYYEGQRWEFYYAGLTERM